VKTIARTNVWATEPGQFLVRGWKPGKLPGVTDEKKVKMQKSKCKTGKGEVRPLPPIRGFDFCILHFDFLSVLSA
jgi:hypothetical protein